MPEKVTNSLTARNYIMNDINDKKDKKLCLKVAIKTYKVFQTWPKLVTMKGDCS